MIVVVVADAWNPGATRNVLWAMRVKEGPRRFDVGDWRVKGGGAEDKGGVLEELVFPFSSFFCFFFFRSCYFFYFFCFFHFSFLLPFPGRSRLVRQTEIKRTKDGRSADW